MNHIPFYFENKSQTNSTRNRVKFNTALYFCEAMPNAAVFIVVYQTYVNNFILKFILVRF